MVKGNASAITTNLNTVPGFIGALQPGGSNPAGNTPQAYLTILFFDERFNFIAAADGGVAQQQVAASVTANGDVLVRNDIKAPKNGYAYVYISNQSNQDVFFDNLKVQVVTGNIIEENHYYAYGLKIAGISSKKLGDTYEGTLKNSYLYNDKELFEDGDLNWYDYGFRNYDPQIGRFTQLDPLTDDYPFYTPYQYAGCEPIANVDVDGLEPVGVLTGLASQGATNITTKVISSGAHAGKLSVSFFMNGTACNLLFKIPTISVAGMFTSVGIQTANAVSNLVRPDLSKNVSESLNQQSGSLQNDVPDHVPQVPRNSATIGPAKELNSLEKQKAASRRAYHNDLNGYNEDGSKKWTTKLADNKTFQRFEKMTGTMADIGGLMTIGGGVKTFGAKFFIRGAIKPGSRSFFSGAGMEAEAIKQGFQTLGQTRAGKNLQNLIDSKNLPWSEAKPMWRRLSQVWAKGVPDGSAVPAFLNNPQAGAIWFDEQKILLEKGVKIIKQ